LLNVLTKIMCSAIKILSFARYFHEWSNYTKMKKKDGETSNARIQALNALQWWRTTSLSKTKQVYGTKKW